MRPGVRTATLDGYLGLARSAGLDPARILTNAGLAVADLAVPDKWVPAAGGLAGAGAVGHRVGTRGLRPATGRPAPAGDARPAQRRAEPGARPAQRPDACCAGTSTATTRRCGCAWTRTATWPRCGCGSSSASRRRPDRRLELATAALLGHRPRAARPAVGAAVDLLHPPGTGIARRPPRGVRAPAAVRARVHRAGLLRHRARRREHGVRPAAPALRRPAAPGTRRSPGRDGDRAGDAAGRDAAARRPVLDPPGGPQPGGDAADAAPPAGRRGAVVLGDRAHDPGGAGRALPRGRPLLAHRRLGAARVHRARAPSRGGSASASGSAPREWRATSRQPTAM